MTPLGTYAGYVIVENKSFRMNPLETCPNVLQDSEETVKWLGSLSM